MDSVQWNVTGLQNKQCKLQVKNALDKIKGVQEIAVDMANGTISVDYNEPATQDDIKACIENTGFKVE